MDRLCILNQIERDRSFQKFIHKALAVIFSVISLQTGIKVIHLTVTDY